MLKILYDINNIVGDIQAVAKHIYENAANMTMYQLDQETKKLIKLTNKLEIATQKLYSKVDLD